MKSLTKDTIKKTLSTSYFRRNQKKVQ